MAKKKTLTDALGMTSEQEAFIRGGSTKTSEAAAASPATAGQDEKLIDLSLSTSKQERIADDEPLHNQRRRTRRNLNQQNRLSTVEILDQVLVPVTIRLQHRTSQALKRAYLEQKLAHAKPDTAQEIVEEAVGTWLEKTGYLD